MDGRRRVGAADGSASLGGARADRSLLHENGGMRVYIGSLLLVANWEVIDED